MSFPVVSICAFMHEKQLHGNKSIEKAVLSKYFKSSLSANSELRTENFNKMNHSTS